MMIDSDGNIVYSTYKQVNLGANVFNGAYKNTNLSDGFRKSMLAASVDDVFLEDCEAYAPAYGAPTPWVFTPFGDGGGKYGVLALQLSVDEINDVMTGKREWVKEGLGETGETYLAGPGPADALGLPATADVSEAVSEQGGRQRHPGGAVAKREVETGDSVLLQPINTTAVNLALSGQSGVTIAKPPRAGVSVGVRAA